MFSLKTIIAATDLTPRSAAVLPRAAQLARDHGAELILVHVLEKPAAGVKRLRLKPREDPRASAETTLAALAARYPDLAIRIEIHSGKPDEVVAGLAQETDADLIVLGLHKSRRVLETLRMTQMERITQATTCPVLIAHTPSEQPYRKVLGAVTFAPASATALHVADRIAPGAELHAIHALQLPLSAKLPTADLMTSPEMTEAEMLRSAFLDLDTTPARLALPEIVPGGVHEVLQFRIAELEPDLVVIGSHSGRSVTRLGNYARDLMRAPPEDMLIAKPD